MSYATINITLEREKRFTTSIFGMPEDIAAALSKAAENDTRFHEALKLVAIGLGDVTEAITEGKGLPKEPFPPKPAPADEPTVGNWSARMSGAESDRYDKPRLDDQGNDEGAYAE